MRTSIQRPRRGPPGHAVEIERTADDAIPVCGAGDQEPRPLRAGEDAHLSPIRSTVRPPRTRTTECSCRLWPSPMMYAVTTLPSESFILATLRSAEFGLRGLTVKVFKTTPLRWGRPWTAGA